MPLRILSHLAPSLPAALFEALAADLGTRLGTDVVLTFDASRSGPRPGEHDPVTAGEVDLAFVCATSYVWMTPGRDGDEVEAVVAWAPTDPRSDGRAIYFGDVLVPTGGARSLEALAGRRVAYNDDVSLSGYHSLRLALAAAGVDTGDVTFVHSGSHLRSLGLLADGAVDAAAIDSNVWRRRRREDPDLAATLVALAALGPHPTQPLVARPGLPGHQRDAIRDALLTAHTRPRAGAAMAASELARFVAVSEVDYAPLRADLAVGGLDGLAVS